MYDPCAVCGVECTDGWTSMRISCLGFRWKPKPLEVSEERFSLSDPGFSSYNLRDRPGLMYTTPCSTRRVLQNGAGTNAGFDI